jgi:prepilin-type N-terminal cleavage/methylation domain-containing protein
MASRSMRGFSLLEMMAVISISLIMMAVTFITLQPVLKDSRTNQAYSLAMMQLRNARSLAIQDRQQYIVCFGTATCTGAPTPLGAPTASSIQIFEWPAGTALTSAIQISNLRLPQDIQFQTLTGIPTSPSQIPDGFGTGSVALDFDQGVGGGIRTQVMFAPDGSAQDTNGNLNSGILYLARSGDLFSSRAITLFGASGRLRGWRLVNKSGTLTWIQQ